MTIAAAGLVLGFLVASAYGAIFHLIFGGPSARLLLYLIVAWLGFAAGHWLGAWLNLTWLKLGAVQLLSASLIAWAALLLSRWLAGDGSSA